MLTVKILKEKIKELDYDMTLLNPEEEQLFNRLIQLREYKGLVRHLGGEVYLVLETIEHIETGEELVVCKSLNGDYKKYAIPIDIFLSKVDKEKYPEVEREFMYEFVKFELI